MATLIRAISWPLISPSPLETAKKICNGKTENLINGSKKNGGKGSAPLNLQQLIAARRMICRRYYTEGGWGYIIVVVSIIVNFLTHGLQLSASLFLMSAGHRFNVNYVDSLGKLRKIESIFNAIPCAMDNCKE